MFESLGPKYSRKKAKQLDHLRAGFRMILQDIADRWERMAVELASPQLFQMAVAYQSTRFHATINEMIDRIEDSDTSTASEQHFWFMTDAHEILRQTQADFNAIALEFSPVS